MDEKIIPVKWLQEINDITVVEWKMYNKKLNQINEVKLKDFQYKILNRILVTNRFLYKSSEKKQISVHTVIQRVKVSHTCFLVVKK